MSERDVESETMTLHLKIVITFRPQGYPISFEYLGYLISPHLD